MKGVATNEDLTEGVTISRRNPVICSVMKDLKYIESRERGIDKIIKPRSAWKIKTEVQALLKLKS